MWISTSYNTGKLWHKHQQERVYDMYKCLYHLLTFSSKSFLLPSSGESNFRKPNLRLKQNNAFLIVDFPSFNYHWTFNSLWYFQQRGSSKTSTTRKHSGRMRTNCTCFKMNKILHVGKRGRMVRSNASRVMFTRDPSLWRDRMTRMTENITFLQHLGGW